MKIQNYRQGNKVMNFDREDQRGKYLHSHYHKQSYLQRTPKRPQTLQKLGDVR